MREIKFRCWDGRCMLYFDLQDIEASDSLSHGKEFQLNDTLMQFTGLKDKNGKEIYEGDIVGIYHCSNIVSTQEVKWNNIRCAVSLEPSIYPVELLGDSIQLYENRYEVIGNIYENPELVGGTQKGLDLEG